ncbi:MAG: vitamin K epoxide reductase family protein [Anaerolineales bacterium]|nr:vitamin K epoxide reductase family protein [Anaerolineales bacterium]MCX7609695.1 vitamin K epoxide reductase family protein [Anaerolineales bacterium]MDW8228049.1 vitamin K epoxide reductase family protein [Anaerolineales bacterium]
MPSGRSTTALRTLSLILAFIGILDAAYLLIYKLTSNDKMCLGSGDCATVNYSPYSEVYGIPVSLIGLIGYLAIASVLLFETRNRFLVEQGPLLVFGMSLIGLLFSAYLTYIEAAILQAYCPFCIISAIVITLIFILAVIRLIKHTVTVS